MTQLKVFECEGCGRRFVMSGGNLPSVEDMACPVCDEPVVGAEDDSPEDDESDEYVEDIDDEEDDED